MLNGGGRPEAQAAHIRPVEKNGPDSVRNGIAMSGTFHWMFDRGLITIAPDYAILLSAKNIPGPIRGLVNETGRLVLPADQRFWPHEHYLAFHRETVFKG